MNDVRSVLDRQMGAPPPPTTIDLNAIISREQRRARRRRAGVGVSALALAAAAAVVAGTVLSTGAPDTGSSDSGPTAGGPSDTPSVSSPSIAVDPRAAEAARLTTVLQGLLHQALPDAQFARSPLDTALDEPTSGPLVFADTGTYFVAMAKVSDRAGVSNIIVRVGKTNDALVQNHGCVSDPPPRDLKLSCGDTALGAGSYLVQMTSKRGTWLRDLAEVVRPAGNVVDVEIANSVHYYTAERPSLNLSMAQLTALAKNTSLATTD